MNKTWFALVIGFTISIHAYSPMYGQTEISSVDTVAYSLDLSDVVVTAQYRPTALEESVLQIKTIKAEEIKRQGFLHLQQVLEQQLNLRISSDPILGNGLQIQGIGGQNVALLIDGVPMIGRVGGNIDLSQVNLQNVERIEIVEGALSAQYGSNAAGGVINIIRKKTQRNTVELEQQHQIETIGNQQHSLRLGYQKNKWLAQVYYTYYQSQLDDDDNLRALEVVETQDGQNIQSRINPWNPKEQHSYGATLKYRLSDSLQINYNYQGLDEDVTLLGELRRPQFRPYTIDETFSTLRTDHSFQIEGELTTNVFVNSTTAYNRFNRSSNTERTDIENDSTYLLPEESNTDRFQSWLQRSSVHWNAGKNISFLAGVEYFGESGSGPRIRTEEDQDKQKINNYAAWVSGTLDMNAITLIANLRYGYNDRFDHPVIPSLQLRWAPHQQWTVKSGYAHGFRAPSLKELFFEFIDASHYIIGNTDLKAENARNVYASVSHKNNNWQAKLNLFYNRIDDRIVIAAFETARFNYQNLSDFTSYGGRFEFSADLMEGMKLNSGINVIETLNPFHTDIDDDYILSWELKNQLQYMIPKIKINTTISHRFFSRQIQYFLDSDGALDQGDIADYHLLNFTAQKTFWDNNISVVAGIQNLLDVQNIAVSGGSGGAHSSGVGSRLINWGRSPFVRLDIRWPIQ